MAPIDDPIQYPSPKRLYLMAVGWTEESLEQTNIAQLTQTRIQRCVNLQNDVWVIVDQNGWCTERRPPGGFLETHICAVAFSRERSAWVFAGLWPSWRTLHVLAESGDPTETEGRVRVALANDSDLQSMLTYNPEVWLRDTPRGMFYRVRPMRSQSFALSATPGSVSLKSNRRLWLRYESDVIWQRGVSATTRWTSSLIYTDEDAYSTAVGTGGSNGTARGPV
jgi:hypothetical protein